MTMKIAATADIHACVGDIERLRVLVEGAALEADVLVMGGGSHRSGEARASRGATRCLGLLSYTRRRYSREPRPRE